MIDDRERQLRELIREMWDARYGPDRRNVLMLVRAAQRSKYRRQRREQQRA